jgi:hypothetical protein
MHNVRVSINDQYGLYDLNSKRLEIILDILGLKAQSKWKQSAERESPLMVFYAKTLEREFLSPLTPVELKLHLKSAELAEITHAHPSLAADEKVGDKNYARLCDADVWVKVKSFVFTSWDKIAFTAVAKQFGMEKREVMNLGFVKLNEHLSKATPETRERLRDVELSILNRRHELVIKEKAAKPRKSS